MRRRALTTRVCLGILLGAFGLVTAGGARAEEGASVVSFSPSEAGSQWFTADSLNLRSSGYLSARLVGDYAYKPLVIYNSAGEAVSSVVEHQAVGNFGVSSVFFDRFRVAANLPVSLFSVGSAFQGGDLNMSAPDVVAVGDARLSLDARVFGHHGDAFTAAVGGRAHFPTAVQDAYVTQDSFYFDGHLLFAGSMKHFAYAGRMGYNFDKADFLQGSADAKLAMGATFLDGDLLVGPEASYMTPVAADRLFTVDASTLEVLLGSHYNITPSWRAGLGGGVSLMGSTGSPLARGMFSVEWTWNKPVPPSPPVAAPVVEELPPPPPVVVVVPEPPKVVDTDNDGVPDDQDTCPTVAGTTEPNIKAKGCPVKIVVDEKNVIDSVFFDKNGDSVKQSSNEAMTQVLETLKGLPPNSKFRVEGHTDNKIGKKKGMELSKKRADAVVKWFVDKGFATEKFNSVGMGPEKPVDSNATKKGRAKNRRVEVYIVVDGAQPVAPEGTEKK